MNSDELQRIFNFDDLVRWALGRFAPIAKAGLLRKPLNRSHGYVFFTSLKPDMSRVSTSYVERQNLTMRMGMRRFARLTNGFSKKVENLAHAVSLHYMHCNFARPHQTLTNQFGRPITPVMAAGKADHVWSCWEIAELL